MKVTSAEAKKLLEKLTDERQSLLDSEARKRYYHAAVGENPEDLRPDYDFQQCQELINEIDKKIIRIKHCVNIFNITTEVIDGLTIDQVLVKLPMLNADKNKFDMMRRQKERDRSGITGSVIDYIYTSYDPKDADKYYKEVSDKIRDLQIALDQVNNNIVFEIEI